MNGSEKILKNFIVPIDNTLMERIPYAKGTKKDTTAKKRQYLIPGSFRGNLVQKRVSAEEKHEEE